MNQYRVLNLPSTLQTGLPGADAHLRAKVQEAEKSEVLIRAQSFQRPVTRVISYQRKFR